MNEYRKEGKLCAFCDKPAHKHGEMCGVRNIKSVKPE
jgi:hypothetical protein